MSIYDFKVKTQDGKECSLSDYEGKVLLIVNTATGCGFTPQYEELQNIYPPQKRRRIFTARDLIRCGTNN